jgi:hypothetical protein
MHLKRSLVADTIIRNVSATRNYEEKCAPCWSFSYMSITMHGLENVQGVLIMQFA